MTSKIVPTKRVVVPTLVPLEGFDASKMVRSDPDTKFVDVIQAFSIVLGEKSGKQTVNDMLNDIDEKSQSPILSDLESIELSKFTRCRWKGNAGRESLIGSGKARTRGLLRPPPDHSLPTRVRVRCIATAPLPIVVQMLTIHPSTKTKAIRSRIAAEQQTLKRRLADAQTATSVAEKRIADLEASAQATQHNAAVDDDLQSRVAAAESRLRQLEDLAVIAEDAMCLAQLQALYRRVHVTWTGREQCQSLWLGQYTEVREQFAGKPTVTRAQIIDWLRTHATGKRFWLKLCERCGLPPEPFDSTLYEIEHVQNAAWSGADHFLNFMILPAPINNSVEFRTGPCHLKMIMLGRANFALVQRFARWHATTKSETPRDAFLLTETTDTTVSVLGGLRQPKLCFKRVREE